MNEAIIKLAISGGYDGGFAHSPKSKALWLKWVYKNPGVLVLDPLFWRAIAKAKGWKCTQSMNRGYENSDWAEAWHDYINVLETGGDEQKFWEGLV